MADDKRTIMELVALGREEVSRLKMQAEEEYGLAQQGTEEEWDWNAMTCAENMHHVCSEALKQFDPED